MLLVTPTFAQTKLDYTVEEAIEVLETSLNSQQRSNGLYALRVAREKAAPAADVLARIVAQAPTSAEANYAAEALARIGEPAVPLIVSLSQNGLDWSILFAWHTYAFPNDLDEAFMNELMPIIEGDNTAERRFNALVVLQHYHLERESANRICKLLKAKSHEKSRLAMAVFIAPKGNDREILNSIESIRTPSAMYVAACIREQWRRRPILEALSRPHVRKLMPPEEKLKFEEADAELSKLANRAMPEAMSRLREAHDAHDKYLWVEVLRYLDTHASLPFRQTIDLFDAVQRQRGNMLDRTIVEFKKELLEREQGRVAEERLDDRSFFDPKSDKAPANAFVQATNFKFFYPPMNDRRFRSKKLYAVAVPDELAPDFEQVFLSAQDGKLDAAKAKQPFVLIGWLPGGGHPSKISHQVMECSIDGRSIECDLEFTYHVIPGTGPGIPSRVFVAAKMPALPAGEYSIRFQIVKSWFDRGDGLMRADPKRDMLETEPYHTTFVVGE